MTRFEWVSTGLTVMAVLFIPLFILVVRGTVKWTRTEDQIGQLITKMDTLIKDKDKTHQEMLKQMGDDRRATDRRLRWLEENVWFRNTPRGR